MTREDWGRRIAGGLAVVICLAACSSDGEAASGSPGPAVTATPLASASERPPRGAVPDGFPVMEGAELVTPPPAELGLVARWTADVAGPAVYDYYVAALPAAGFRVEQAFPGGAAAVIRFRVPDGRQLDLSLTASGHGTQIDLQVDGPEP